MPRTILALSAACTAVSLAFAAEPAALSIEHSPVSVGLRGQAIIVRAKVLGGTGAVQSIALYCAVSRDAAPFKFPMQDSGGGVYSGTIPASVLGGVNEVFYYVEAKDADDATAETPWYTIEVKSADETPPGNGAATPEVRPREPERKRAKWVTPALIAGGAVAAGGAAYAVSQGDGGGSSGGSSDTYAGAYVGNVTTCFQPPGAAVSCGTRGMSISIAATGLVVSDNLHEGARLEGRMSGANFVLVAQVDEPDRSGEIRYVGTVVNDRVVGTIQGTATTAEGVGTYTGTFTAIRQ